MGKAGRDPTKKAKTYNRSAACEWTLVKPRYGNVY
jgi:hypothetical protein